MGEEKEPSVVWGGMGVSKNSGRVLHHQFQFVQPKTTKTTFGPKVIVGF